MDSKYSDSNLPPKLNVNEENLFLNEIYSAPEIHLYHKLLLFAGSVWAACRMNAWCFEAKSGQVLNSFSAHEKDLAGFFVIGKCLDYVKEHPDCRYPFLLSDSLGMLWIAEYSPTDPSIFFVFGPVFASLTSPLIIAENLDRMNFSFTIRKQLEAVLSEMPILSQSMIEQYARMLHFSLTGEACDSRHFLLQKAKVEIDLFGENKSLSYEDMAGSQQALERGLAYEAQLLDLVREGRRDDKLLTTMRASGDIAHYVKGNPLRSAKDELIMLCTKYMLTAEQAGLPPRIGRTLSLRYVKLIEGCRSQTELADVGRSMTDDFIWQVAARKNAPEKSREVLIAEDYIRANLTSPLSIEEVARHVGYTDYYLSRKFARETGMKFADYVNRERVRYAQTLLRTGTLPVQAISDTLQFSSLSYFGRVFKKFTGMTPLEFREGKES